MPTITITYTATIRRRGSIFRSLFQRRTEFGLPPCRTVCLCTALRDHLCASTSIELGLASPKEARRSHAIHGPRNLGVRHLDEIFVFVARSGIGGMSHCGHHVCYLLQLCSTGNCGLLFGLDLHRLDNHCHVAEKEISQGRRSFG